MPGSGLRRLKLRSRNGERVADMFWAIASSIFVIYLYRKLNAQSAPGTAPGAAPADTIEAEIAALNAQIAALGSKIAGAGSGSVKP
jgi:hypothetical protein